MFRRDKNNKLDNEGLRRMREAIRQRLDEETAAAGETTQPAYPPATPTGEGVTNPKTFCRVRRCVMVDNLRIY